MVSDELPMRVPTHRFQIKTSPYDDQIRSHPYSSIVPEAGHLRYVGATHSHVLPSTISRLDVAHTYNHCQLSDPSSAPQYDELTLRPRFTHPSYSLSPVGSEHSDDTHANCANLGFSQTSEVYNPWGPFYPSLNPPPSATYTISPPTLHHSIVDPTSYPDFPRPQSSWSTANIQVNPVDEYMPAPSNYYPPAFPLHNANPSPRSDYTSEPCSGTLDASVSYPCLWTDGGVICNVMVQATRSHMNRHLHAYHGFGGSDTRQTKCCWAGCGETMQQGSIARHMVTCHLQAKVTCPMCSKKLSRQDVISKH